MARTPCRAPGRTTPTSAISRTRSASCARAHETEGPPRAALLLRLPRAALLRRAVRRRTIPFTGWIRITMTERPGMAFARTYSASHWESPEAGMKRSSSRLPKGTRSGLHVTRVAFILLCTGSHYSDQLKLPARDPYMGAADGGVHRLPRGRRLAGRR